MKLLLPLATLALAGPAPAPLTSGPELYERVMERAQELAQARLLRGLDFVVDRTSWETAWEVRSQHYVVRTNHSWALGDAIARGLDWQLGRLQELLGTEWEPTEPLRVWIFPSNAEYNQFGDDGGADEHSSFYGSYFATHAPGPLVAVQYDPNYVGMYAAHSAVHQFVQSAFGRPLPLWISEGLAHYFAFEWVRGAFPEWAPGEHERLRARYPRLRELLGDNNLGSYLDLNNPTRTTARLTSLAMLFRYLLEELPQTARPASGEEEPEASFAEFLRAVVRNRNTDRTGFARLYQQDAQLIEQDFRDYDFPRR